MLQHEGQLKQTRLYFEEIGGLEKVEKLQNHPNDDIYKTAYGIVEKFLIDDVRF